MKWNIVRPLKINIFLRRVIQVHHSILSSRVGAKLRSMNKSKNILAKGNRLEILASCTILQDLPLFMH